MKHKAIFSLQACLVLLSLSPPTDERRNEGTQKVTKNEKSLHRSNPPLEAREAGIAPEAEGMSVVGGLMSGTGATLRSGRVRVLARRTVVPDARGGLLVKIGTSEVKFDRYGGGIML